MPGQWLSTSDEDREETLKELKQVAVKSRAKIEPIESQHVTLWAAEDAQQTYLRDVQKLEKFYHTGARSRSAAAWTNARRTSWC